jgi:DNA helicase-2/ATP-dependent DNA helicase PcrA
MNFEEELNSEQYLAVKTTDGPIIILAGAGSGKTRVLVYKVLYLVLERNIRPENILMVTFTNKAAGEMKERIHSKLLSQNIALASLPTVGTFHSLCAKILRIDGMHIGIPREYQIFDSEDQVSVVKQALERLDISSKNAKPKSVLHTISQAKNQLIDPKTYNSIARGYFQKLVAGIYTVYQELLEEQHALDFDDLILATIRLFKEHPAILEKYQKQFQYILVDEYQDTNHAQFVLTKLLSGGTKNICIVGDFSQSIYSFRGADFKNLEKFKIEYPNFQEFSLSQNYRSTQNILNAASSIISNNSSHPILSLWTKNSFGETVEVVQLDNEHHEAEFIIQHILLKKKYDPEIRFSDFAVLYRMNAQSRALEETFLHHGIPYNLVGGTSFYERREVKDLTAYLAYFFNPSNKVAYERLEKIGKRRLNQYLELIEEIKYEGRYETITTIELLDGIFKKTGYLDLYDETDPEDKARLENIKELRSVAIEFPTLPQFLENIALVQAESTPDGKTQDKKDAVTFMTIHAAKGLEFKTVFIIGMEEGLFPNNQSLLSSDEIEEERRLCYVGVTRAGDKLFLLCTKRRLFFGQTVQNPVSRFIYELPESILSDSQFMNENDIPDYL